MPCMTRVLAPAAMALMLTPVDAVFSFEADAQGRVVAVVLHQNGAAQRAPRIEGEPVVPKEVSLDPALLEVYVGRYQLPSGHMFWITRQDAQLFAQLTGQAAVEVFPSGPREFFYKVVDARLTFEADAQGKPTAVVLRQNGLEQRFTRIPDAPVQLPADVLRRYAGRYQLTGGPVMTITVENGRLFVAPEGQLPREIVLTSERDFYVKEINGPGRFELDEAGRVTTLVLLPSGTRAPRID